METGIFAKLGSYVLAGLIAILPATLGAALSAYIDKEKTILMGTVEKFTSIFFGIVVGYTLGQAAIKYWHIDEDIYKFAIQFVLGVIGMNSLVEIRKQIPEWLTAARKKYLGE